MTPTVPEPIREFLRAATPDAWVEAAVDRLPDLLIDHANCELKAASTAISLIYRYPERTSLCDRMSRLAREELRHFEQVRRIMSDLSIPYRKLSASRYAASMRENVRDSEPARLLDSLLVGALIEARSCERFAAAAPRLPRDLGDFYRGLLASEARHFENYLALAENETGYPLADIDARLNELLDLEASLIMTADEQFRFHSGVPVDTTASAPRA